MKIIDNGCPDIKLGAQRFHGRTVLVRKLDIPVLEYSVNFKGCQVMYFVVVEVVSGSAWLWDGYMEN